MPCVVVTRGIFFLLFGFGGDAEVAVVVEGADVRVDARGEAAVFGEEGFVLGAEVEDFCVEGCNVGAEGGNLVRTCGQTARHGIGGATGALGFWIGVYQDGERVDVEGLADGEETGDGGASNSEQGVFQSLVVHACGICRFLPCSVRVCADHLLQQLSIVVAGFIQFFIHNVVLTSAYHVGLVVREEAAHGYMSGVSYGEKLLDGDALYLSHHGIPCRAGYARNAYQFGGRHAEDGAYTAQELSVKSDGIHNNTSLKVK